MTTKAHKLLTGTDLHEPKGVDAATAGQVYVADGAGSGSWVTINTTVTASTGDLKLTMKTVADDGWLLLDDSSIGSATSGAGHIEQTGVSVHALYLLIWNNIPQSFAPVSGGRGGSAAADWAANKKMDLPKVFGRALGVLGAGAGLSNIYSMGQTYGDETRTLTRANLPAVSPTFFGTTATITVSSGTGQSVVVGAVTADGLNNGVFTIPHLAGGSTQVASLSGSYTPVGVIENLGSGTSFLMIPPTTFFNLMVKL